MKALRNFEALFAIVLGVACAANYALDTAAVDSAAPAAHAAAAAALPAMAPSMHVVVVSAKRMSEAEKQAALEAERKPSAQAGKI